MLITSLRRAELLPLLPKGGTVAEIGVDRGAFSRQILTRAEPAALHLIDPWAFDAQPNVQYSIDKMLSAFHEVQTALASGIVSGRVLY